MKSITLPSLALPMRMPRFQPPVMRGGARLRIGAVEHVVLVDEDAAQAAELLPLLEELAVLVEDLEPDVAAVGDEEPSAANRWRGRAAMRNSPGPEPSFPSDLMNLPSLVNFEIRATVSAAHWRSVRMPVGDEDVAVGRHDDVVRFA